ncbi:hypothetical protein NFI96_018083, partial [Prochilodus magdalenae]
MSTHLLIVDFRKQERVHTPITINGASVERVSSFKFLGVHITEELTWSEHTTRVVKKAQQRLFFLRRLKRFGMDPRILRTFNTCTVESTGWCRQLNFVASRGKNNLCQGTLSRRHAASVAVCSTPHAEMKGNFITALHTEAPSRQALSQHTSLLSQSNSSLFPWSSRYEADVAN